MTLTQIRYFTDAAKHMSFQKAAEENFVVQQVISKQIRKLEEDLGYSLFARNGKTISLTESGRVLYEFWERMLREQNAALAKAGQLANEREHTVRIGSIDVVRLWDQVSEAIHTSSGNKNDIKFEAEIGLNRQLYQKLLYGQLDCIFFMSDGNRKVPAGYQKSVICRLHPALIMAKDHPWLVNHEKQEDLVKYPFYALSDEFSEFGHYYLMRQCERWGFKPQEVIYAKDILSLEMALYNRSGCCTMFVETVRNFHNRLAVIPIENPVTNESGSFHCIMAVYTDAVASEIQDFLKALQQLTAE